LNGPFNKSWLSLTTQQLNYSLEADVDLPTLTADAEKLQRTLVNLLAMRSSSPRSAAPSQFPCGLVPNLKPSCLAFSDTGEGIPPEALKVSSTSSARSNRANLGARCQPDWA